MINRIVLVSLFSMFLISCAEKNYWNEEEKSNFLEGCERGNNKKIEEAGVNPYEQMGTSVQEVCECMLTKIVAEFPEGAEDQSLIVQTGAKNAKACLTELRK